MDFERGSEFLPIKPQESESGYSEKESAKVIEGSVMDSKIQKKRTPMQKVSRQEKILSVYRENTEKILRHIQSLYELQGINFRQEEQIIEEIKKLRHLQEELLNALLLDQKGGLTQESLSKEAWNLIQ